MAVKNQTIDPFIPPFPHKELCALVVPPGGGNEIPVWQRLSEGSPHGYDQHACVNDLTAVIRVFLQSLCVSKYMKKFKHHYIQMQFMIFRIFNRENIDHCFALFEKLHTWKCQKSNVDDHDYSTQNSADWLAFLSSLKLQIYLHIEEIMANYKKL